MLSTKEEKKGKNEFKEEKLCCLVEPYWYESWLIVLLDTYKLLILLKTWLSFVILVEILLLANLENLLIFLNAFESLEIELPIVEKSIEFSEEEVSFGDKITYAGVFNWAVLFFFW